VVAISEDGTLETLDKKAEHEIKRALDTQFGKSIELVKAGLKQRAKPVRPGARS
jgi:hypothetical protein